MLHEIKKENYSLTLSVNEHNACVEGGDFGEIKICKAPFFDMRIKRLSDGENITVTSSDNWKTVKMTEYPESLEIYFEEPEGIADVGVLLCAKIGDEGVKWSVEVINDHPGMSVMEIKYPMPVLKGKDVDMFIPRHAGMVLENADSKTYESKRPYPNYKMNMLYFAVYGKQNGIYLSVEDGKAASKMVRQACEDGVFDISVDFIGIGASLPANSFKAYGQAHWKFFKGDWYDAAQIYADFVQREAEWLPEIDNNGRTDTPQRFKDIPFWVCDYIPNSESQGANKPMKLSAGSDIYEPEYWYKAPIELQKQLGVPIAYHVYNWHEIPFNIEYPHFLPAKKVFMEHAKELRENNIYVLPYINAVSWEMYDAEMKHKVSFENTGFKDAVIKEDGSYYIENYPQTTISGKTSKLSPACGTSVTWHKLMLDLSKEMQETLDIDGIYYDQIAAVPGHACFSREHGHLPGGGSTWVEGYNRMMTRINAIKPKDNFYFTECTAEPYMKQFDGYLTWMWVSENEVPAFPAVYAGYIQLLGRSTLGEKKDDFDFFKYCTAKSLLYGQQLGWCKADIINSPKHMEFLKKYVDVRYKYTSLFNGAKMLRSAKVTTDLPEITTAAGVGKTGIIRCEQVLSGAWRYRDGSKTVIFASSIADTDANYTLTFNAREYGIIDKKLPDNFVLDGDICTVTGRLGRYDTAVWEIDLEA